MMGFREIKEEFDKVSRDDFASCGEGMAQFLYWHLRLQFEVFARLDSIDVKLGKALKEGLFQRPWNGSFQNGEEPKAQQQHIPRGDWDNNQDW